MGGLMTSLQGLSGEELQKISRTPCVRKGGLQTRPEPLRTGAFVWAQTGRSGTKTGLNNFM